MQERGQGQLWSVSYTNIYTFNFIVDEIDAAKVTGNYVESDRDRIKAEARVSRAFEYWMLVNMFAKQYNPSTAESDPGVPLVVSADVAAETPSRHSVAEVYEFLVSEMMASINDLPDDAVNEGRFDKAGGHALLARIYLSMGNYEQALASANAALQLNGMLMDYNNADDSLTSFSPIYANEQYVQRFYQYIYGVRSAELSQEAIDLYDFDSDRRVPLFFSDCNWVFVPGEGNVFQCGTLYMNDNSAYFNPAVSIPEMYLIKAECLARLDGGMSK